MESAALLVLLLGLTVSLALLLKGYLRRLALPDLVGYLLIGMALRFVDERFGLLDEAAMQGFEALGQIGLVALLFHIGNRSKLGELVGQLPRASVVWAGNVLGSGLLGFAAPYFLLGLGLTPSLFAAVAMTATSVGVSVSAYESARQLDTPQGRLFLDTAELDDISAVVLMALLFALAPVMAQGGGDGLLSLVLSETALLLLKLALFAGFCYWFSRSIVPRLLGWVKQLEIGVDPLLTVLALGLIIAATAALLGFSLAIGAFFAGIAFSRDREMVRNEASLSALYDFVIPFFFIGIGLRLDLAAASGSLGLGALLVGAAVVGKVLGSAFPARFFLGWRDSVVLGVSMVPHAEVTMIVLSRGRELAGGVVSPELYAAGVMVVAVTSVATPLVLVRLLSEGGD